MQNNSGSRDDTPQAQGPLDARFNIPAGTSKASPKEAEAQFNLAKAHMEYGRYDESLAPLDRAIALAPGEALFYLMKADALAFLGRNHEAAAIADSALALSLSSRAELQVPALLVKGHADRATGRLGDALAVYDQALSLSPDNASALVSRGAVLHDMGRLQEALADFDHAIAQNPADPMAWYDRGNALKDLNRRDEALDSYQRATSINPEFSLAWNNAATLLYQQGRHADAVDYAEHATSSNPRLHNSWYVKGRALLALQRREEAQTAFDQAVSLDRGYLQSVQILLGSSASIPL
jgi:tetratricopeptide (TPR) repeat protein